MASIFKRGQTWWIHYYVEGRSASRSLKTTNKRIALDVKKNVEALEVTGQLGRPSRIPIGPFLESFCEYLKRTQTSQGARKDLSYLRVFFGPCCSALEPGIPVPRKYRHGEPPPRKVEDPLANRHVRVTALEQVTPKMVASFLRARVVHDGISPKSANRQREVLHRMFNYAIEHHGYVCPDRRYRNPVQAVTRAKEAAPVIGWLTDEQIKKQLAVLADEPQLHAVIATCIYAGLRREELVWLTVDDVRLDTRMIQVQAKTVGEDFWQPKTRRNRRVPVSEALLGVLRKYKPPAGSVWYFPTESGGRWHPDSVSLKLRRINRKHGLPWSCLDFRHTFGSHLAQKGESLYKISELMGNSPEICRRHYAALVPEAMHDVVEFGRPAPKPGADAGVAENLLRELVARLADDRGHKEEPQFRLIG